MLGTAGCRGLRLATAVPAPLPARWVRPAPSPRPGAPGGPGRGEKSTPRAQARENPRFPFRAWGSAASRALGAPRWLRETGAGNPFKMCCSASLWQVFVALKEMRRLQPEAGLRRNLGRGHGRGQGAISLATRICISRRGRIEAGAVSSRPEGLLCGPKGRETTAPERTADAWVSGPRWASTLSPIGAPLGLGEPKTRGAEGHLRVRRTGNYWFHVQTGGEGGGTSLPSALTQSRTPFAIPPPSLSGF